VYDNRIDTVALTIALSHALADYVYGIGALKRTSELPLNP
jgi:hypothetical protein